MRSAGVSVGSTIQTELVIRTRFRHRLFFVLSTGVLILLFLLNIWLGESGVSSVVTPSTVFLTIGRHIPVVGSHIPPFPQSKQFIESIVWEQRVPRAIGGAIIGVLLAMAGVAFQSLLMNPLADPYMVGVSAGSALGSVLVILLGGTGLLAGFAQPLAAFATGLAAMSVVYMLARVGGRLSAQTFLLGGIVVGTFLWSLIPLMLSMANRSGKIDRQGAILAQLLGNLQFLGWNSVGMLMPFALAGGWILWRSRQELNLMAQGEESAAHLGVDTESFKRKVIIAGSLVTAAAVSVAGIIAFVGLVVPHSARRIVGPDHRNLLPASMVLGGIVLEISDLLSRVLFNQLEIGVITSLFGAPMFCYLLRKRVAGRW